MLLLLTGYLQMTIGSLFTFFVVLVLGKAILWVSPWSNYLYVQTPGAPGLLLPSYPHVLSAWPVSISDLYSCYSNVSTVLNFHFQISVLTESGRRTNILDDTTAHPWNSRELQEGWKTAGCCGNQVKCKVLNKTHLWEAFKSGIFLYISEIDM